MFDARKTAETIVETGGATVSTVTGEVPTSGYAVSLPGHEVTFPVNGWHLAGYEWLVINYQNVHSEALSTPGNYLGAWVSGDTLYLDVSTIIAERSDAIAAGHARAQLAIFDLGKGEEITLTPARYSAA